MVYSFFSPDNLFIHDDEVHSMSRSVTPPPPIFCPACSAVAGRPVVVYATFHYDLFGSLFTVARRAPMYQPAITSTEGARGCAGSRSPGQRAAADGCRRCRGPSPGTTTPGTAGASVWVWASDVLVSACLAFSKVSVLSCIHRLFYVQNVS